MKKDSAKSLIEDAKPLTVAGLKRQHALDCGAQWTWSLRSTGDQMAVTCLCDGEARYLRLHYSINRNDGTPIPIDDRIDLAGESSVVGGWRWWLVCPRCKSRRRILFMPAGKEHFACRVCYDLRYKSSLRSAKERRWMREVLGRY